MKGMARIVLALGLMAVIPLTVQARDILNFYNGHTVQGKLTYIAGDLIYYKTNVGKSGSAKRLNLTNRQDVVRTHIGQKFIGEVVFLDSLWVEMKTPVGQQKIRRLWVDDIVLGAPRFENDVDFIETPTQLLGDSKHIPATPGLGGYGRGDCPPCDDGPSLPSEGRFSSSGRPMVEVPSEAGLY